MKWPILVLFIGFSAFAKNQKTTYGVLIDLPGVLNLQIFPGPPNYASIAEGDDIERHYYLKLDSAIDVLPNNREDIQNSEDTELNVKVMQLFIADNNHWVQFRKAGKGAHVQLSGTLFHRFTGYHHARILMTVKGIKLLRAR